MKTNLLLKLLLAMGLATMVATGCGQRAQTRKDKAILTIDKIKAEKQLGLVEYDVNKIVKGKDKAWYPFSGKSILCSCKAYLKAGIDLETFNPMTDVTVSEDIDGTGTVDADDRVLTDRIHLSEDGCLAIAITVDERTGDLACSPAVNSMGCFDSDDMDMLYELISEKVDDLLKQASNKAGSIEAFLEKRNFREQIKNFVHSKSGRRPMIIFNISYV